MRVARIIVLSCLILVLVFGYSPAVQYETGLAWQYVRPGVLVIMDSLYTSLRNVVAGNETPHGIENDPPEVNYDIIITRTGQNLS